VALAEGGQQQLLGVPPVGVAVEGAVGRALDGWFAGLGEGVLAAVGAVAAGASSPIPGPVDLHGVVMCTDHGDSFGFHTSCQFSQGIIADGWRTAGKLGGS
jgi:hypothetical protein